MLVTCVADEISTRSIDALRWMKLSDVGKDTVFFDMGEVLLWMMASLNIQYSSWWSFFGCGFVSQLNPVFSCFEFDPVKMFSAVKMVEARDTRVSVFLFGVTCIDVLSLCLGWTSHGLICKLRQCWAFRFVSLETLSFGFYVCINQMARKKKKTKSYYFLGSRYITWHCGS